MGDNSVVVREAERRDCNGIHRLIRELAVFEKMENQLKITPQDLVRDGFDLKPPLFSSFVVEAASDSDGESELVGYAIYFTKYSTWEGKTLHLEDLYVSPSFRGKGIGTQLLQRIGEVGLNEGFSRLTLECLEWNKGALDYYKKLNGRDMTEEEGWHVFRFTRDAFPQLSVRNQFK